MPDTMRAMVLQTSGVIKLETGSSRGPGPVKCWCVCAPWAYVARMCTITHTAGSGLSSWKSVSCWGTKWPELSRKLGKACPQPRRRMSRRRAGRAGSHLWFLPRWPVQSLPECTVQATPPVDGAFADCIVSPTDFAFTLPAHVTLGEGAVIEPLSVGVYAVRRSEIKAGQNMTILGAGPIGLVTLQAARGRRGSADCCGPGCRPFGSSKETWRNGHH